MKLASTTKGRLIGLSVIPGEYGVAHSTKLSFFESDLNRVFGKKKAPGPPPPSLGEASSSVGQHMNSMDGKETLPECDDYNWVRCFVAGTDRCLSNQPCLNCCSLLHMHQCELIGGKYYVSTAIGKKKYCWNVILLEVLKCLLIFPTTRNKADLLDFLILCRIKKRIVNGGPFQI